VKRSEQRLRDARVTLGQLALVSASSAIVSALVVISALGETGPERAVIAALRTHHVIHASSPAAVTQPAAAAAASTVPAAAAPTPSPAPTVASTTDNRAALGASAGDPAASAGSSDSGSSDPGGSDSGAGGSGAGAGSSAGAGAGAKAGAPESKIKHVFVIALSTPSYQAAFGKDSVAQYLNSTLRPRGALLTNYHTLGDTPMPDYVAMVSGQAPNRDTSADCPTYTEFHGRAMPDKNGLVSGAGCVYPNTTLTIGDQLDSAALPWRAYVEGMATPCEHPDSGATTDPATSTGDPGTATKPSAPGESATSGYSPTSNPFVFFHSLLDLGDCQSDDLPYSKLAIALRSARRTPSYIFISPNACDSGASITCPGGQPGGIAAADAFLRRTLPSILNSPAYRTDGALLVLFTVVPQAGAAGDAPIRTGALVLSPFTTAGSTDAHSYDPYSVLRFIEDNFGLSALGRAKTAHRFDAQGFSRHAA
jgi:phosphatidylinositol-3-phosphatase